MAEVERLMEIDPPSPAKPSTAPRRTARRTRLAVAAGGVLWTAAVVGGFAVAMIHERTHAPDHPVATCWPKGSICQPPADNPMLVVFIHPKCPCTRASLEEITHLNRRCGDQLEMQFVFLQPHDASWRSEETEHWRTVRNLNAGRSVVDTAGLEHRRFNATTSGEVFLFTTNGQLAFHGGVTVGRGHAGESAGRLAIEAIVKKSLSPLNRAPVFGCALESSGQAACSCGRKESMHCDE